MWDTARQIITICILLLGASFTLITSNSDRISSALNNSMEMNYYVYNDTIINKFPIFYKFEHILDFIGIVVGIACFFLIWTLALNSARYALNIEPIESDNRSYLQGIAGIAAIKQTHCREAIIIIMIGSIFLIGFVMGIFLMGMGRTASWVGTALLGLSNVYLLLFIILWPLLRPIVCANQEKVIIFAQLRKIMRIIFYIFITLLTIGAAICIYSMYNIDSK